MKFLEYFPKYFSCEYADDDRYSDFSVRNQNAFARWYFQIISLVPVSTKNMLYAYLSNVTIKSFILETTKSLTYY